MSTEESPPQLLSHTAAAPSPDEMPQHVVLVHAAPESSSGQLLDGDQDDSANSWTCCGLTRTNGDCRISNCLHLVLGLMVLVLALMAIAFLFADVGLHRVEVSTVTENGHASSSIVAGIFAGAAILLSLHQIYQHRAVHYTHKPTQKYTIRVLCMVPIYAATAFLGLVFLDASSYFDFLRTCYEAYTIYCFLMLLTKYVGGHNGVCDAMLDHGAHEHWPAPMGWCLRGTVHITPQFVSRLKLGTLQYSFVAPVCALIAVCATKAEIYEEGTFAATNIYVYTTIAINLSQMVALFCLVWLYHGIHDTIAVHKPLAKFLSVKAVVFLSFWQSVLIAGLVHWGVIHNGSQFDTQQIQVGLQDLCIAIEMFIAAVAHYFIFPVAPYEDGRVFEMLKESRPTQHGIGVEMAVVVTDQPTSPAPSAAVGGAAPRREKMKSTTLEAIKAGETQEEVQTDEMQQEVAQVENATAECVTD